MDDPFIRPRIFVGIDWGAPREVLVSKLIEPGLRLELWWQRGYKAWGDRLNSSVYYPTQLTLAEVNVGDDPADEQRCRGWPGRVRYLATGGRLGPKLLAGVAEELERNFGITPADIKRGRTLWLP